MPPEPAASDPALAKKPTKKSAGARGGDVTPRGDVGTAEAPAGTRLTPSKNQTITILIVRHQKPHRTAAAAAGGGTSAEEAAVRRPASSAGVNDDDDRPATARRAPPPPPVPVPLTIKRRTDEPNGELALAELLPAMQAKLQMAVPVSGVYGPDGARRASISEFVAGETCVVKSAADNAREDQRAFNVQRRSINKLAKQDPRKRRMVVKLLPTALHGGVVGYERHYKRAQLHARTHTAVTHTQLYTHPRAHQFKSTLPPPCSPIRMRAAAFHGCFNVIMICSRAYPEARRTPPPWR